MSHNENLLTALAQLLEVPAPARLLLYYRLPNTSSLRHAAVTRIENGDCAIDVAGKSLLDAVLELAGAQIARAVLVKNVWISAAPAADQTIPWESLTRRLQEMLTRNPSHAAAEPPVADNSDIPDWIQTAKHRVLEVFERYYGSAASSQIDALLRMHEKAPNALPFLDAAERVLAKVASPERARADLAKVRPHLQLTD